MERAIFVVARPMSPHLFRAALSLVLFLSSAFGFMVRSPEGRHCPMAEKQLVSVVTIGRNCCGKIEDRVVLRKPAVGDADFVQCRCAEHKAAAFHAESGLQGPVVAITPPIPPFDCFAGHFRDNPVTRVPTEVHSPLTDQPRVPPTPPPNFLSTA